MGVDSELRELYRDLQDAVQATLAPDIALQWRIMSDEAAHRFASLQEVSEKIKRLEEER